MLGEVDVSDLKPLVCVCVCGFLVGWGGGASRSNEMVSAVQLGDSRAKGTTSFHFDDPSWGMTSVAERVISTAMFALKKDRDEVETPAGSGASAVRRMREEEPEAGV